MLQSGALSIPSVSVSHDGNYTCLVSNQLGYAQELVTLIVQGRYAKKRGGGGGGGGEGGGGGGGGGGRGGVMIN